MVCRNCGGEIPEGKMFCPFCGTEVQLVPDYTTIDMMAEQKLMEPEDEDAGPEEEVRRRRHPAVSVLMAILIILGTGAAVYGMLLLISRNNLERFGYQKTEAERRAAEGRYSEAVAACDRALALHPDSADVKLIRAGALFSLGQTDESAAVLEELLASGRKTAEVYEALIRIRIAGEDAEAVARLVKESGDEDLITRYGEYLAETPEFSLEKNQIYEPGTRLKISAAGYGRIYYTLDGSQPDESSTLYSGSIALQPGASHVRAVFINEKGVVSDTADAFFTVRSDTEEPLL